MNIDNASKTALERLWQAGFAAWLVGGCVRDYLLGLQPKDMDITTSATPEQTKEVFADCLSIDTGIKHGTVTVCVAGEFLEITTYRIDGLYLDGRRPENIIFTDSLREDLARRDFTINAMAYAPGQELQDFFGGRRDLEQGLIRAVGNAEQRFQEDALRILRAMRFASVLGFEIEENTARAMVAQCELLRNLSAERIFSELKKILCGKAVRPVLLKYAPVLDIILPELSAMRGFVQYNHHHEFDVWEHTLRVVEGIEPLPHLRWAALLHDVGKPSTFSRDENGEGHFYKHPLVSEQLASDILHRLKADNALTDRVLNLVKNHDRSLEPNRIVIKRILNSLGAEVFFDLLALKQADCRGRKEMVEVGTQEFFAQCRDIAEQIIAEQQAFSLRDLAVDGRDIIALGVPAGKRVGSMLAELLEEIIQENLPNEKTVLLGYLKNKYQI